MSREAAASSPPSSSGVSLHRLTTIRECRIEAPKIGCGSHFLGNFGDISLPAARTRPVPAAADAMDGAILMARHAAQETPAVAARS